MKIRLIAVGSKMPSWVKSGVSEYQKRLPADFSLSITEIPLATRSKNSPIAPAMEKEAKALRNACAKNDFVVALDVKGQSLSTENLAEKINRVRENGHDIALLIGGPDGLTNACLESADARWSLSALTLPHPIVRVVLAEQIYRVWSILNNHPYHRA
ncbi:MAG: 23S rRNA (pseudouridine(1915)-N(3))-methyltransferase RlmH [SAR86 cluster bacterium]|uniref:Ribosomal RNA large subunit methyltransferase H n=1 Tax=SAR86 cluster bacterium TaxID=2030880 RepID=A0A2A5CDP6_9GAMM|nr:23S rRNA (pseudouridine(1915)-N(3))-methyltransferase RlmH [Gammaproteobacteria bacterium AH-315-E17]PCJ41506.1 MAG: 23S rRNA (pseudouridine(1915)-N(3))-methyltransferase RlmH [SAR86 cluster bacterium]